MSYAPTPTCTGLGGAAWREPSGVLTPISRRLGAESLTARAPSSLSTPGPMTHRPLTPPLTTRRRCLSRFCEACSPRDLPFRLPALYPGPSPALCLLHIAGDYCPPPSPPREHWASPRPEAVAPAHPRTAAQRTLLTPFSLHTELLSLPQRLPGQQQALASPSWARWVPGRDSSQQHQLGEAGCLWQEGAPRAPVWGAPCGPSLPHRALLSSCRDSLGSFVTS